MTEFPYSIYKSDGTAVSVPDNAISTTFYSGSLPPAVGFGTALVGRNAIDYGAPIAQNFLQLTENFCSNTAPPNGIALQGQIWFDKANSALKVNVSSTPTASWQKIITVSSSETGTVPVINPSGTPKDGDVKVVGSVISMWANGAWQQVFPAIYS